MTEFRTGWRLALPPFSALRRTNAVLYRVAPGLSAAIATGLLTAGSESRRILGALLVAAVVEIAFRLADGYAGVTAFLPLVRCLFPILAPVAAFLFLCTLKSTHTILPLLAGCAAAGLVRVVLLLNHLVESHRSRQLRIAVVGQAATAAGLAAELAILPRSPAQVIGYVDAAAESTPTAAFLSQPRLGQLGHIADTVRQHRLDLLLIAGDVPRLRFFEEMAASAHILNVSVLDLSSFYEDVFGHVPLQAINAAWFQAVLHPRSTHRTSFVTRLIDVSVALAVSIPLAPLLAILAVLIKRDGGPAVYRQTRIGERGQPFRILKLRTMRVESAVEARWSSVDDDRVTAIGRVLRRTHLDELPQLINILRGDMSLVGPRPEQPAFVHRLEQSIPFYSRRHLLRPGITGWAQVRCGYSGSDAGSLWKLSHDLYYLRHRSAVLDVLIIIETLRLAVADRQFAPDLRLPSFVAAQTDQPIIQRPSSPSLTDGALFDVPFENADRRVDRSEPKITYGRKSPGRG